MSATALLSRPGLPRDLSKLYPKDSCLESGTGDGFLGLFQSFGAGKPCVMRLSWHVEARMRQAMNHWLSWLLKMAFPKKSLAGSLLLLNAWGCEKLKLVALFSAKTKWRYILVEFPTTTPRHHDVLLRARFSASVPDGEGTSLIALASLGIIQLLWFFFVELSFLHLLTTDGLARCSFNLLLDLRASYVCLLCLRLNSLASSFFVFDCMVSTLVCCLPTAHALVVSDDSIFIPTRENSHSSRCTFSLGLDPWPFYYSMSLQVHCLHLLSYCSRWHDSVSDGLAPCWSCSSMTLPVHPVRFICLT